MDVDTSSCSVALLLLCPDITSIRTNYTFTRNDPESPVTSPGHGIFLVKYPHFSLSPSLPITRFFLSPAALVSSSTEDKRRGKLSSGAPSPSTLSFFLSLPSGRRQPWTGIIPGHEKAPQAGGAQISASSWTPLIVNRFGEGMSPIEEQIKSVSKVLALLSVQAVPC